jgi:SAM-dependent methyltransferase
MWDRDHRQIVVVNGQEGRHTVFACGSCSTWFVKEPILLDHREAWLAPTMVQYILETQLDPTGAAALLGSVKRPAGSRMLHLGCGAGIVVDMAIEMLGWDALGIDSSLLASEGEYLLGPHIEHAYISTDSLPAGPFDVIIISGVLERYESPLELLMAIREILAPSGDILIEVGGRPNVSHSDAAAEAPFRKVWPSAHGMARAMRAAGFDNFHISEGSNNIWATNNSSMIISPDADTKLCPAYIRNVALRIEPSGWLWNGLMSHAFKYYSTKGAFSHRKLILERIAEAWRETFDFDLRLPSTIPTPLLSQRDPIAPGQQYPFSLASILVDIADRTKPEISHALGNKFTYYSRAFAVAIETSRYLRRFGTSDQSLTNIINTSRQEIVELLKRLAQYLRYEINETKFDLNRLDLSELNMLAETPLDMSPEQILRLQEVRLQRVEEEKSNVAEIGRALEVEKIEREKLELAFRSSTSWRLTAPLRFLSTVWRKHPRRVD